jgi:hypothetical protein
VEGVVGWAHQRGHGVHRLLDLLPIGAQLVEHAGHRDGLGVEDIEHCPHPGVDFPDGEVVVA